MATTATIDQNTDAPAPYVGRIGWAKLTAANTATDGTGTVATLLTSPTNGCRPFILKARALGTNVKTVARVFINNGADPTVATNNTLWAEIDLPETEASNDQGQPDYRADLSGLGFLPSGYKINVCIGTAVSAGWQFTCTAGDF